MKKALIYLVVFLGIQLVAGGIVMAAYILMKGQGTEVDATGLIITTALADVTTLVLFLILAPMLLLSTLALQQIQHCNLLFRFLQRNFSMLHDKFPYCRLLRLCL